jgi:hypothetical protein
MQRLVKLVCAPVTRVGFIANIVITIACLGVCNALEHVNMINALPTPDSPVLPGDKESSGDSGNDKRQKQGPVAPNPRIQGTVLHPSLPPVHALAPRRFLIHKRCLWGRIFTSFCSHPQSLNMHVPVALTTNDVIRILLYSPTLWRGLFTESRLPLLLSHSIKSKGAKFFTIS